MDGSMKPRLLDQILISLFLLGLCAVAFIAGATALHYRLPGSRVFLEAFEAADTWYKTLQEQEDEPLDISENTQAINESIITYPTIETWDKKSADNGYTLVSTGFMDSAWLVDMTGKI